MKLQLPYLLPFLLIPTVAFADCDARTASYLSTEHQVGDIQNLTKTTGRDWCTVEFDIDVDGKTYHRSEREQGLEQTESLCYYAKERSRKNLLLDLGGKFKSEAALTCQEGTAKPSKIKKGDTILESEVGPSPIKKSFKYNGAMCRMFQEHYVVDRELRTYNGVICQINNSATNWLVVDKW